MLYAPESVIKLPHRELGLEWPQELDGDPDYQYFVGHIDWLPEIIVSNDRVEIKDPVHGKLSFGEEKEDRVIVEFFKQPFMRRLFDVEQFTLPRNYTTVPNTSILSRGEHEAGLLVLVTKFAEENGLSKDETRNLQIWSLIHDIAHTFGSHQTEKLFQTDSRAEDLHDIELRDYAKKLEIDRFLSYYGYDLDEILSTGEGNLLDSELPNLSLDRIDYALREIRRWIPRDDPLNSITYKDFKLDDNQEIYMEDQTKAEAFARAYLELGREHWHERIHRLQLELYTMRTRRIYASALGDLSDLADYHPRDRMYYSDRHHNKAMRKRDSLGNVLNTILIGNATQARTIGWRTRWSRVENRLTCSMPTEESPPSIKASVLDAHLFGVSVEPESEHRRNRESVSIPLSEPKLRQIDPNVMTDTGIKRLSDIDPNFKEELRRHEEEITTRYIAKIAMPDRAFKKEFMLQVSETNKAWKKLLKKPRIPADVLREVVRSTVTEDVGKGVIKIDLS